MSDEKKTGSRLPINIVVPVYNAEKVLKKCLRSVVGQSFRDWRLILIDDGSKDASGKICDEFAAKDKRIQVFHQENKGSTATRQRGIGLCGDDCYIMNLDADDYLRPNALKIMYKYAQENDADMVRCEFLRCVGTNVSIPVPTPDLREEHQYKVYNRQEILDELYISYFGITKFSTTLCATLYKSEIIKQAVNFPRAVKFFAEDLNLNIRILPECQKVVWISDKLYCYRLGGNTDRFMPYYFDDCLAIYALQQELMEKYPMPQDAGYYCAVQLKNEAYEHLLNCYKFGKYDDEKLLKEIEYICNIPQVVDAVNHPKDDSSGCPGFRDAAKKKRYDDILALVKTTDVESPLKKFVKKIVSKL
ncbi:MAG: glycosyltransferase [Clostridiales bacterium]|nr:glycosyltransferase [Clostridiales bacterium]